MSDNVYYFRPGAKPAGAETARTAAATQPAGATSPPAPPANRYRAVINPAEEDTQRPWVARGAGLVCVIFLASAFACLIFERPVIPIRFGSALLIELAIQAWPSSYWLAAIHNACIAAIAATFLILTTTAHVPMPSIRGGSVHVYRRRSRFVGGELILAMVLGSGGIALHASGHPLLAVFLESPAAALLLRAAAIAWVPSVRNWLLVTTDHADGLGNRLSIGGGVGLLPKTSYLIPHERLLEVRTKYTLAVVLGYVSLLVDFQDDYGVVRRLELKHFCAIKLGEDIRHFLAGGFKVARHPRSLMFPLPGQRTEWRPP